LIQSIPKGRVATYGIIAQLADCPQGARGVVWLLHSSTQSHRLPWQRVIKAKGILPFPAMSENGFRQMQLLQREGVEVVDGRVDLSKYLWNKKPIAAYLSRKGSAL
jgi:methylated-DNA-protein-cysteine methyltransferase-like protein